MLTLCHPLVDLLDLSLLQYVRMLLSSDMGVLIAFLLCMGEEHNLYNFTAFQIVSPRLSNNHQEKTYLADPPNPRWPDIQ